jgi:1,4-dihydroxy-2-naphthoate octaprenyltransferase
VGALATELLAINNVRDMYTDVTVGKRTLPVMFGLQFGRVEIAVLPAVAYLAGGFWCVSSPRWHLDGSAAS